MARASLARGLSSDAKSSVSLGSMSFNRNRSSVTRKGLANCRARLIRAFISLLFTRSPSLFISDPYPLDRKFGGLISFVMNAERLRYWTLVQHSTRNGSMAENVRIKPPYRSMAPLTRAQLIALAARLWRG